MGDTLGTKIKAGCLFASPSFAGGAARLLDWGNAFDAYSISNSAEEAYRRAMAADWNSVGDDLYDAMMEFQTAQSVK